MIFIYLNNQLFKIEAHTFNIIRNKPYNQGQKQKGSNRGMTLFYSAILDF